MVTTKFVNPTRGDSILICGPQKLRIRRNGEDYDVEPGEEVPEAFDFPRANLSRLLLRGRLKAVPVDAIDRAPSAVQIEQQLIDDAKAEVEAQLAELHAERVELRERADVAEAKLLQTEKALEVAVAEQVRIVADFNDTERKLAEANERFASIAGGEFDPEQLVTGAAHPMHSVESLIEALNASSKAEIAGWAAKWVGENLVGVTPEASKAALLEALAAALSPDAGPGDSGAEPSPPANDEA